MNFKFQWISSSILQRRVSTNQQIWTTFSKLWTSSCLCNWNQNRCSSVFQRSNNFWYPFSNASLSTYFSLKTINLCVLNTTSWCIWGQLAQKVLHSSVCPNKWQSCILTSQWPLCPTRLLWMRLSTLDLSTLKILTILKLIVREAEKPSFQPTYPLQKETIMNFLLLSSKWVTRCKKERCFRNKITFCSLFFLPRLLRSLVILETKRVLQKKTTQDLAS